MINIQRFIDKIASIEGRQGKDVVLPISEARALRDEITKLLLEQKQFTNNKPEEVIQIQLTGGKW